MGTFRTACKSTLCVFLLLAAHGAQAGGDALKPLQLKARYRIAWSGIALGRILIEAQEDASRYHMQIDTKTTGVGALITADRSLNVAHGRVAEGSYLPEKYESKPLGGTDHSITVLTYDAQGKIASRLRDPDDDPAWRPPVPFAEVDTASDPVTAAFTLRRALYAAMQNNMSEVSTRTYDGARLATMKITRQPNRTLEIMEKPQPVVDVTITRTPINGYSPKDLKKFKKGDPEIHLYFSDDADFLPLKASANAGFGDLTMTLIEHEQ